MSAGSCLRREEKQESGREGDRKKKLDIAGALPQSAQHENEKRCRCSQGAADAGLGAPAV